MTTSRKKTAAALLWCSIGAIINLLGLTLPGCVLILIGALLAYRASRAGGYAVCALCVIALFLIQTVYVVYRSYVPLPAENANALTSAPSIALIFCLTGAVWFLMSGTAAVLRASGCGKMAGDCRITQALALFYLACNAVQYVLLGTDYFPYALMKLTFILSPIVWLGVLVSLLLARDKLKKCREIAPETAEEMRKKLQ